MMGFDPVSYAMGAKSGGGGGSTGGGVLIVTVTTEGSNRIMDKTWQEIHDALYNGNTVVARYTDDNVVESTESFEEDVDSVIAVQESFYKEDGEFVDHFLTVTTPYLGSFNAESKDGYPTQEM